MLKVCSYSQAVNATKIKFSNIHVYLHETIAIEGNGSVYVPLFQYVHLV